MTTVGTNIKRRRQELHMSAEQLASKIGCSPATIYRYENGSIDNVNTEKLSQIAKALMTTPELLMGWDSNESTSLPSKRGDTLPKGITPMSQMERHYVPLIGSVAAGIPIYAEQNAECYVEGPRKADYALKVDGDSMVPTLQNGDTIFIRQQDVLENGEIGVVLIDDTACVKHVYTHEGGLLLVSDNPAYPPRVVEARDCEYLKILGKVIGFTRMW